MTLLIKANQLSKKKDRTYLYRDINLELNSGNSLHLKGPNGIGKSTLLRQLAGLGFLPETATLERSVQTAFLGHQNALKAQLTPIENLAHTAACWGNHQESLPVAIEKFCLGDFQNLPCQELSAGQQRRVALAAILLTKAPLWLLDEPFVSLDTKGVSITQAAFHEHLQTGGGIIFSSHLDLYPSDKQYDMANPHDTYTD